MTLAAIVALLSSALALASLVALAVVIWPPGLWAGALLAVLAATLLLALLSQLNDLRRRRERLRMLREAPGSLAPEAVVEQRLEALEQQERRLEFRELRLARRMRSQQLSEDDEYIDLLEAHPDDEELAALVETDRKLMGLIEAESQLAFERVLDNRYASEDGVDADLIFSDVRSFIEKVARLYQPDTADPLLETDIELLAKSTSSGALHLLVVIDGLPLDLKSYNIASVYRLIRRGASYYGTYKALRPYLEHGLNALHAARMALSANPGTAGATWLAGKITSHGARALGEHLLQRQALTLLHDFIRVIGFEAAMVYGGHFRHRDANWVYGAELVNLEISRGKDLAGRDLAIGDLCRLALRHEFDRIRLLRHLANGKPVPVAGSRPEVLMTRRERAQVAERLAAHCRRTGADLSAPKTARWRQEAEARLSLPLDLPKGPRPSSPLRRLPGALRRLRGRLKRAARGTDDAG